jgi:tripartite-type tricarboxylate transporter receptor subunit TctC
MKDESAKSADPIANLKSLMKSPPFKTSIAKIKEDYMMLVLNNFAKITSIEELLKRLDEDEAIVLLQFVFKAMELWH